MVTFQKLHCDKKMHAEKKIIDWSSWIIQDNINKLQQRFGNVFFFAEMELNVFVYPLATTEKRNTKL